VYLTSQGELERAKAQIGEAQMVAGEQAHQLSSDLNNLRRELQEQRGKAKIVLEGKSRVEMELISVRGEMGRMEIEAHKQSVCIKEGEAALVDMEQVGVICQYVIVIELHKIRIFYLYSHMNGPNMDF
jgi:hypothetical protein